MAATTHISHDAVFKSYLTRQETAVDFLQVYLPPAILQRCNLHTVQLESGSFVEENLRACYSDILYSMRTVDGKGYIYALIEHQSSPDRHMTFRLMRYAIAAMQRHLDQGNTELPLVIPVLFYHGKKSPYPYSMNWLHGFSDPQLAQQVYSSSFPLADITMISDEEIEQHRGIALLELIQKHIRDRDLIVIADKLGRQMAKGYNSEEQIKASLAYLLDKGSTSTPQTLIRLLLQNTPQHKELLMTIAEQLRQSGRKKGLREGMLLGEKKGREQGREELRLEMARDMLAKGLQPSLIKEIAGLTENDLKYLRN